MKQFLSTAVLGVLFCTQGFADPLPGYDRFDVKSAHRAAPIAASVWYPAGTRTYRGIIGENAIFEGTSALVGAGVAEGPHPLVLMSHGSGGTMDGLGWLASGLVTEGAMVLAVNHPGSTSGDSSPRRSVRLGERARDLSAALDALLADPAFASYIDQSNITAIGFSLGGATALNLGGLRFDPDGYADYCAAMPDQADCVFLARGDVDFSALPEDFGADAKDPRVAATVAIDPGFTYVATEDSIAATTTPVTVINLGTVNRMDAVDVSPEGSDLIARLPNARLEVIAPAHHFTFLAECKPGGAQLLAEEQDDPVCTDPEGVDRAGVHEAIIAAVAKGVGL